jgi:uncharacterized RDD family membrane protein YckC
MYACRNHPAVIEGLRYCSRCGGQYCSDCIVSFGDRLYCGPCKNEQLRDMQSGIDRTRLNYAGFGKRFGALIIDRLIVFAPLYVLFLVVMFSTMDSKGEPSPWAMLLLIPMIFAMPLYDALMIQYRNGQTIGKRALKLRVVRIDGSPVTAGQAWGRAAMRFLLEGCISIIDYIPALFTEEKTTLHDMASGTRVVEIY